MAAMPALTATAPLPSNAQSLARLVALRRVEVLSQAGIVLLATGWLRMPLEVAPMIGASIALALLNLFTQWRLARPWPVGNGEYFAQLCADVLALAVQLYYAGGSANPFVSLFLLPLTIAAATLPGRHTWAMAGVTLGAYTLLLFFNQPLPAPQGDLLRLDEFLAGISGIDPQHASHSGGFALHVIGMWFNFLVSALIVAYFLSRLATALRERDQELGRSRERALRQEQVLALGTLAAGAAHKLGTPLATMAVVLRDMELEEQRLNGNHPDRSPLGEDLALLRQQVDQCKQILTEVLASAGAARDGAPAPSPLAFAAWLEAVIEGWRLLRPRAQVTYQPQENGPTVRPDRGLEQALLNLLDNAADASPQGVEVHSYGTDDRCVVDFLDRGPGLAPEVAARLGQPFVTTKAGTDGQAGGMGIGLFLTNATLERWGGTVEILAREGGGCCTRVTLPTAALMEQH